MKTQYIAVLLSGLWAAQLNLHPAQAAASADADTAHAHAEHEEHSTPRQDGGADHAHGETIEDEHNHDREHGESSEDLHEETGSATLTAAQMAFAGIRVEPLQARRIDYQLYAPGEIRSNGYTSYRVAPRTPSVVLRRLVALGDHVSNGQVLVTLFSENVARAQADYRVAAPDWQRVQELGRQAVGDQRYLTARSDLEAARATLLAYGLSATDIEALGSQSVGTLGEYSLRAEINGAVLSDAFEQGQRVEAGEALISLADESQLWVEAHLPANLSLSLGPGTQAEVVVDDVRVRATGSQEAHTIDPVTRTRIVRLLVDNPAHRLHPGMFAEVYFRFRTEHAVLAVPENALMRGADGHWTVFVEDHPGEFQPVEVELGQALGSVREIRGIPPGTRVVTEGAFFVDSQIAKGGFDPHNH